MMSNHDAMYVCGDCRGCQVRYPGCYDLRVADRVPVPTERLAAAAVAEHWRAEDATPPERLDAFGMLQQISDNAAINGPTLRGMVTLMVMGPLVTLLGFVGLAIWVAGRLRPTKSRADHQEVMAVVSLGIGIAVLGVLALAVLAGDWLAVNW